MKLPCAQTCILLVMLTITSCAAVLGWWRRSAEIIAGQSLSDGSEGRLQLAAQLAKIASAQANVHNHVQAAYLLLAVGALSEYPSEKLIPNIPTTMPTPPTPSERAAAMQFEAAGLGPAFRHILEQNYSQP